MDDLIRDIKDRIKGATGTATNTTVTAHPRIIYPSPAQIRRFGAAVAAGTAIKDIIGGGFIMFPR